jgi:hypothetical protein
MIKSKSSFLSLVLVSSFFSLGAFAEGTRSVVKCTLENNRDRIVSIEIEETDLEGQLVARTVVERADHSEETIQRVSNGSLSDSRIYLFETGQIGIGTTHRYLERSLKTGNYSVSHYFQCDWINDEEHCSPGADFEYRGSAGDASCKLLSK